MLQIALYVCRQTLCSSLSMAMDSFNLANQLAPRPLFKLQRFSLDGQRVDLDFASIRIEGGLATAEHADLLLLPATGSSPACAAAPSCSPQPACSTAAAPPPTGPWPASSANVSPRSNCR